MFSYNIYSYRKLFLASWLACFWSIIYTQSPLLQAPQKITPEEVERIATIAAKNMALTFFWSRPGSSTIKLSLIHGSQGTGLFLYTHILPNTCPPEALNSFTYFSLPTPGWYYDYNLDTTTKRNLLNQEIESEKGSLQTISRRIVSKRVPQCLTPQEAARKLAGHQVVLYTGAGISAPIVPTMSQLYDALGFKNKNGKSLEQLLQAATNPNSPIISIMDAFFRACLYGQPTQAHWILTELASKYNWAIVTENLDLLHQRTGLNVITRGQLCDVMHTTTPEEACAIDYIVTIGLSSDASGFLEWYKKLNPNGRFIAVNTVTAEYLGEEDFYVDGDLQSTLPQFFESFEWEETDL